MILFNKIMHVIKQVVKDEFFRQNTIFFVGSMLVAFFNYLYHPVLGRMMGVEDFGELQFILSLNMQINVLVLVFSTMATNIFANEEELGEKVKNLRVLKNIFILFALALFLIFLILTPVFHDFFKISDPILISLSAIFLLLGILVSYRSAFLQAKQDFFKVSWVGAVNSLGRLIFSVALVWIGFRALGAVFGIIIAQGLSLWQVYFLTKKALAGEFSFSLSFGKNISKELFYGLMVWLSMGALAFFATADVVIIKYFFSDVEAGLYSGIATVARIIYFVAGSVAGVLLASVKIGSDQKTNQKILFKSFMFLCALVIPIFLIFNFFPKEVIAWLIGYKYIGSAYLLPRLSILLVVASVLSLLVTYNLALRHRMLVPVSLISFFVSIVLIFTHHNEPINIVNDLIVGSLLMVALLMYDLRLSCKPRPHLLIFNNSPHVDEWS